MSGQSAEKATKDLSSVEQAVVPSIRVTPSISIPIKYVSLFVLVLQTSATVVLLRYTRTLVEPGQAVYLASTAVFLSEVLKVIICLCILLSKSNWKVQVFCKLLVLETKQNWRDGLKLLVPAVLYVLQNNLLYLALTNLDAATYQVTYQLKILTAAIFSVTMLGRRLSNMKWGSLVILMFGVIIVQRSKSSPTTHSSADNSKSLSSSVVGLVAVLCACLSSGFAGVYFEKLLKGSSTSLWMRNLQLAFFSIIFALCGVLFNDWNAVMNNGFFQGYNKYVLCTVGLQGVGGLIVGAVVKYADNILKGFATSISIIVSSLASYYLLNDFQPSTYFMLGSSGVLLSTYLYSQP